MREDSACRLSALETPGWKPVVHDRQDACPPARLSVLAGPPAPARLSERLYDAGFFLSAMFVGGMTVLASLGAIIGSAWAAQLKRLDALPKLSALGLLAALAGLAWCLECGWYVAAGAPIFAAGLFMGLASVSIYSNIVSVSHPSRFLARSMVYLIAMQMGNALGVQMVALAELSHLSVLGTGLMVGAIPAALTAAILLRQYINPLQMIAVAEHHQTPSKSP